MAVMIPEVCDKNVRPHSEIMVYDALQKNLSSEWTVFHSFDYVSRDLNKNRWEGEIDFLIYHPNHGLLVLEVKGGPISYHEGQWYQEDRPIDPFGQARKNKYAVLALLTTTLKLPPRTPLCIRVGHAVCFPSCGRRDDWPAEAAGLVLAGAGLPYIDQFVTQVLKESALPQGAYLNKVTPDDIRKTFRPYFDYGTRLADRLGVEERQIFTYTHIQCAILDAFENFRQLQIQGCAGSGKTVMAIGKAIQLANRGKQVLLLCYNHMLAAHLQRSTADCPGITAMAFFDFAMLRTNVPAEEAVLKRNSPEFWQFELPRRLYAYLARSWECYDAVIVDEGQDFSAEAWQVIEKLVTDDGCFYVFFDPDQNLYQKQLLIPPLPYPPVKLNKNCRNTRKIFQAILPYASDTSMQCVEGAPEGGDVLQYIHPDAAGRRALLADVLVKLITGEKLAASDIVILGGHSLAKTCIGADAQVGPYRIVAAPSRAADEIYYCTYMKFKGCEARAVILLDVDPHDPRWQDNRALYTAMSRARHLLVMIKSCS